jgi:hypothetical protein
VPGNGITSRLCGAGTRVGAVLLRAVLLGTVVTGTVLAEAPLLREPARSTMMTAATAATARAARIAAALRTRCFRRRGRRYAAREVVGLSPGSNTLNDS